MNVIEKNPYQIAINKNLFANQNSIQNRVTLGDQMFVYAVAQLLACKNFTNVYVDYEIESTLLYSTFENVKMTNQLIQNLFKVVCDDTLNCEDVINIKVDKRGLLLQGKFNNLDYFLDNETYIQRLFVFKESINNQSEKFIHNLRDKHKEKNLVSISLLQNDVEKVIKALNLFNKKNTIYLLYTDDIHFWLEKLSNDLIDTKFVWMKTNVYNDVLNMCIMSKCDVNVIDNSSFSLWGAFLNENLDKQVVVTMIPERKSMKFITKNKWILLDFNNTTTNINEDVIRFKKHIEGYFNETMSWDNFGLTWTVTNMNTLKDINDSKTMDELLLKLHYMNYRPVKLQLQPIVEQTEEDMKKENDNKELTIEYNREYPQTDIVDLKPEIYYSNNKSAPINYILSSDINKLYFI